MDEVNHLLLPLPLAELLFVCLGPLSRVMEEEGHRWYPLVQMVLSAYMTGRDDMIAKMYGPSMVGNIDIVTVQVSEELCTWVADLSKTEEDFQRWSEELDDK